MTPSNTSVLSRIPSLRSLLFFNAAGRHLNLVRAADELRLTQSALSRQIKALEEHLGVRLFERGPRGLRFTEEGELLYDFTSRAFLLMDQGVSKLAATAGRHTLVVSVARSFAQRVLASRLGGFVSANPEVDLRIDVHRYYADLESSGADISIRLGKGDWHDYHSVRITDDVLIPVCAPGVASRLAEQGRIPETTILLRNRERDYVGSWAAQQPEMPFHIDRLPSIDFNDSATVISTLESGTGITVTRSSLVADALEEGTLVRPFAGEVKDGLNYYAVQSARSTKNAVVKRFMQWLDATFGGDFSAPAKQTAAP
ncbi:LysR family transcriptional regulator [Alcaligenaceae bacterium]|nr:LysR family transcriptional regulator [Alcaligenaceae bacterium]